MIPKCNFYFLAYWLCALTTLFVDCVRLYVEDGFQAGSKFYHLGNGGYAYHFNTESFSTIYFKCALYDRLRCHGRANYRMRGGVFTETQRHNHPPDPDFVGLRHFRQNVIQQVRSGRAISFREIVDTERANRKYARTVRMKMNLRKLRSPMNRARMDLFPDGIPHSLRELTQTLLAHPHISRTIDGDENLYAGSITAVDGSHHVAFISPRMSNFLSNLKIIQGDGTFKSRPALPESSQCFVIVTSWNNCIIPIAWFLMEKKTLAAYRAVFHLLRTICPNLNPEEIISDWEYAQQQAWQDMFPNADIQGCLWHLSRAFVKKAKKLGLFRYLQLYPSILDYIRRACAICLLPNNLFDEGLRCLRESARAEDIVVAFLLEPFFNYVHERWIHNPARLSWMTLFNARHRTNNACESHNKMLKDKVGAHRPNVYLFIQALAVIENNANLDVGLLSLGLPAKQSRKARSVFTDNQMNTLSNDLLEDLFHNMDDTILQFLGRASHLFQGAFDDHVDHA